MTAEQLRGNATDEAARGRDALLAAEKLLEVGLGYDAASRAYYAAFHFARALCWQAGETPRTHHGVAILLSRHHVQTGKLPPDTDRRFAALEVYRERADYETGFVLDEEGARLAVSEARILVERMEALLRNLGALPP